MVVRGGGGGGVSGSGGGRGRRRGSVLYWVELAGVNGRRLVYPNYAKTASKISSHLI